MKAMKALVAVATMSSAMSVALAEAPEAKTTTYTNAQFLGTLPANALLASNFYDQNVYDPSEKKLGEIKDLVFDRTGKIGAVIVSVGGFLGLSERNVAVPFEQVYASQRDNKWWLTMNATKDTLKSAAGFKYDKTQGLWVIQ